MGKIDKMNKCYLIIFIFCINSINALSEEQLNQREKAEIDVFSNVWQGGFFIGDPLEKRLPSHEKSQYHMHYVEYKGETISCLHAVYLECIKPYINSNTNVLEIGPGRGAWTRCFIKHSAEKIICVDAKSAKDNGFWEHVGHQENILYHKVNDFALDCIENNSIDYVFSALTFCHISPMMINEYFKSIFKKMRSGAQAFIMYADYDKYNGHYKKLGLGQSRIKENFEEIYNGKISIEPRWYHLGINDAKTMLEEIGYVVINADIDIDNRDPIAHFIKP